MTCPVFTVKAFGIFIGLVYSLSFFGSRLFSNSSKEVIESVNEFFTNSLHPYSKSLLASLPSNSENDELRTIEGQPPSIQEKIEGCRFSPRCECFIKDDCCVVPDLKQVSAEHFVACNRVDRI